MILGDISKFFYPLISPKIILIKIIKKIKNHQNQSNPEKDKIRGKTIIYNNPFSQTGTAKFSIFLLISFSSLIFFKKEATVCSSLFLN